VVERADGFVLAGRASDGADAVEAVGRLGVDLVLMDVHMPGLGGVAACREVLRTAPGTVVVLVSTYDRDDLPDDVRTSGAAAYLHKEELSGSLSLRCGLEATVASPERSC
jgi:DNA-binding NarL/FixJ family response regulator